MCLWNNEENTSHVVRIGMTNNVAINTFKMPHGISKSDSGDSKVMNLQRV